ncbi:MAG: GTPase ObgE [Brevinema sp.]
MIFRDEVVVYASSGKGGDGCVSFRREKFIDNGGPDGGDGGDGGSVVFRVLANLNTLANFHEGQKFQAQHGAMGMGKRCHGRNGKDIVLDVPPGTVVYEELEDGTSEMLADLAVPNSIVTLLKGGKGGWGNEHYKTSVKQSPQYAQKGGEAQTKKLRLELKLIAHVGLAGFPNAGKSSLISRLTNARPKVANYPFTTLVPNLGIMVPEGYGDGLIIADIPGLIEGAHKGRGLGLEFLRHIERTRILLFVLDITDSPAEKLAILKKELVLYSQKLSDRPFAVCLNKIDLMPELEEEIEEFIKELKSQNTPVFIVSAATGAGLEDIKKSLFSLWRSLPTETPEPLSEDPIEDFTEGIDL